MTQSPYREARRVFWILDNGSSHRGTACVERLHTLFPNVVAVHGPIHAGWLNQVEIYFSIVQRKALTPNDFRSLAEVEERLLGFQRYYESIATPFEWRFTKDDLAALMQKLDFPPLCGGRRRVAEYVAEFMNQSTKTTEEKSGGDHRG
jgi:hypothetical protein